MSDFEQLKSELTELLLGPDAAAPVAWAAEVLGGDLKTVDFFNNVFTPAMAAIGDMFGRMDIFLPELIDAAERAQAISSEVIQPKLVEQGSDQETQRGKVLMASVQGDLHDIGKNMVILMLRVNGFEVIDLGVDVSVQAVLDAAKKEDADIVGLSSLMTTSMPYMKEIVERRLGFGLVEEFSVIVGGAPITKEYAENIGADAFGNDAIDAVNECLALIKQHK